MPDFEPFKRIKTLNISPQNVTNERTDYERHVIYITRENLPEVIQEAIDSGAISFNDVKIKESQLEISVIGSNNVNFDENKFRLVEDETLGLYIDLGARTDIQLKDSTQDGYVNFEIIDTFDGSRFTILQGWEGVEKKDDGDGGDGDGDGDGNGGEDGDGDDENITAPDIEGIIENSLKFSINDVVREYTPSTREEESNTLPITEKDRFLKYAIIDDKGNRNLIVNWVRGGELNQVDGEIDVLDSIVVKLANPINTNVERLDKVDIFNTPYYPLSIDFDLSKAAAIQKIEQLTPNFQTEVEERKINEYSDYQNINNLTLYSQNNIQKKIFDHFLQKDNQLVKLNTDFTDFKNFVKFSSAEERVINFHYKIQDIESYTSQSNVVSQSVASEVYKTAELNKLDEKIRNVKNSFDDYEYFLYNDSGSFYSSSYVSSSGQNKLVPKKLQVEHLHQKYHWLVRHQHQTQFL